MSQDIIPQEPVDRHGIRVLKTHEPYKLNEQPILGYCERCGKPIRNPERAEDGMGLCCRYQEPHRRRIRVGASFIDGTKTYSLYSFTKAGVTVSYEVTVNTETGEFSCTCPDHKYRNSYCKHVRRAVAFEIRRERDEKVRAEKEANQ